MGQPCEFQVREEMPELPEEPAACKLCRARSEMAVRPLGSQHGLVILATRHTSLVVLRLRTPYFQ
jgi:hypothetical protein